MSTIVEEIAVQGFEADGEPVIKRWSDGSVWIHFNFMPPLFAEENGTEAQFDSFDSKLQEALGVPVIWDDREVFIVANPEPDTVVKAKAWLESFHQAAYGSNPK